MSPEKRLTLSERRSLILGALRGESIRALSERYAVTPWYVGYLKKDAEKFAKLHLIEAEEEAEFWEEVLHVLEK